MDNSTNKLVPELRFPEFVNEGEWEENSMGNLGQFLGGGTPDRSENDYWVGNIPWISSSDIKEDDIHNISITRFINDKAVKQSATKIVPKGSILFVSRVGVGKLAINQDDLCTSQDFTNFVPAKVLNYFIGYYFSANKHLLQSLNQGTSIKGFTKNDLENLKLFHPENIKEQQKIAACLSSLDELIAAHSQKLEALKDHKKGLMQNLFPQEGETVPKWRFPEFVKNGEWVEKKLGEVCEMQAGKFVSASEIKDQFSDGLFPCYGGNGLRGYTKSFTHTGKFSLIGRQGALCGNVTLADGTFHATEHAVVVKSKENTDTNWLFYELKLLNLNQYATGQAQPGLSVSNLEKLKLKIPKNPNEQQKIAACLSSLDALITKQVEKIEQLKLHKKGLMQGLFPKINE